jgi:hypothetical protein
MFIVRIVRNTKNTVSGKVETLSVKASDAKYRVTSALSNVTAYDTVNVFRMSEIVSTWIAL